ncbi:extracellular solute-binding protein [soil metagenome]
MPRPPILAGFACLILFATSARAERVVIDYWEKWTGFEAAAMGEIVDKFNASQDHITVRYSSISQVDLKLMLAIAGRKPPDVAGIWSYNVPVYVENNALHPLDALCKEYGISGQEYLPIVWKLCTYRDRIWALPTTPASTALYWNKKIFRDAGLDPDHPPASIEELEQINEKISVRGPDGKYRVFGHLPEEPGWWRSCWGYWFGGRLWDGHGRITTTDEGNHRALDWIQSYPRRFGQHDISGFLESAGNFASSASPFISGRVAMVMQGPWEWNFLRRFSTGPIDIGVAPFPSAAGPSAPPVTVVESDILVIPAGSPHVKEAFEFIAFVNRQDNLEQFCSAQCSFSPLVNVSDAFWKNHPHPYIRTFYDLARSPGAFSPPLIPDWTLYKSQFDQNIKEVWALRMEPSTAQEDVQHRIQKDLDRRILRWDAIKGTLTKEWDQEDVVP